MVCFHTVTLRKKPQEPSYFNVTGRGLVGAACKGPFLRPSAIQAGLEMIAVNFVIDSCASALVVWKS